MTALRPTTDVFVFQLLAMRIISRLLAACVPLSRALLHEVAA